MSELSREAKEVLARMEGKTVCPRCGQIGIFFGQWCNSCLDEVLIQERKKLKAEARLAKAEKEKAQIEKTIEQLRSINRRG